MADVQTKLAKQRLSVLELAETLSNVSEACRRRGLSHNQFYEYKRRFQTHGLQDLNNLRPVAKSHPQTTPPKVAERIETLALERRQADQAIELSTEQIAFIEKQNPCFRERHVESSRPGELLSQDTFYVGHLEGVGKLYLHTVVDTYGSYAFGFLHPSKQPARGAAQRRTAVL